MLLGELYSEYMRKICVTGQMIYPYPFGRNSQSNHSVLMLYGCELEWLNPQAKVSRNGWMCGRSRYQELIRRTSSYLLLYAYEILLQ